MPTRNILILDNGAHSIKATTSNSSDPPIIFRNAVVRSKTEKRSYIADELDTECMDYGGLVFRLAFERGILNNWEVEKVVWDRVFGSRGRGLQVDPTQTSLLLTEPVMNLPNVAEHYDQMIFEEYEFNECLRCPGPTLVPFGPEANGQGEIQPECVLVLDAGFSFTHVVPVLRGAIMTKGVRRIDIGGKLLTNHLKELVSFRQWYMMDQTSVIEKVKETCCYVTQQWEHDWEAAATSSPDTSIVRTYVLPDFVPTSSNKLGYLRPLTSSSPSPEPVVAPIMPDEASGSGPDKGKAKAAEQDQLLQMNNERFAVPEVLFNPSIIGLQQGGVAETIVASIAALPEELRAMFWANIVCVGGSTGFPGFAERLQHDLRPFAPEGHDVVVRSSASPTLSTVLSASNALQASPVLASTFVTRAEYFESGGINAAKRKRAALYWDDKRFAMELG